MKRHLNTLFVTTQGAHLAKEGQTVVVKVDGEVRMQLPVHNLGSIVCFGQVSASPFLLGHCAENAVGVSFLTEHGRFLARVHGATSGNVLLRREQYRRADDPARCASIARAIVVAKVANCRVALLRAQRDRPHGEGAERLRAAAEVLAGHLVALEREPDLDATRGIEGIAARDYFAVFDDLISQQKEDFRFSGRSRRPPLDRMNALLSFVYTLLVHDVQGALESVGLDPAVGFLHRDRPGRPGLALDLMEEFRPFFADRLVLSLVNLRQLDARSFRVAESGAVLLNDDGRKAVLTAYQSRKLDVLEHPFLGEQTTVGLLPHLQALLLARHLRGDLDAYPPFFWR
uniref:CRISPR-associated endonuclease Cas1 n=1 Tax=Eiseniibacteriota bacterium TaxID=2212470 RepID=A0A832I1R5_UNCEI